MKKEYMGYINKPFRGKVVSAFLNSTRGGLWSARIPYQEVIQYMLIKDDKIQIIRCGDETRDDPTKNVEILNDILDMDEVKISHKEEEHLFDLLKKICSKGSPFVNGADGAFQTLILRNKSGTEYCYWGMLSFPVNDFGLSNEIRHMTGIHDLYVLDHDIWFEDPSKLTSVEVEYELI